MRRFPLLSALLFATGLLAGCGGETKVEVVKPFRPQYEAFQKQLAQMAAMEPKSAVRPAGALDGTGGTFEGDMP